MTCDPAAVARVLVEGALMLIEPEWEHLPELDQADFEAVTAAVATLVDSIRPHITSRDYEAAKAAGW